MKAAPIYPLLVAWLLFSCTCTSLARNFYFSTIQGIDSRSSILAQNSKTPWKSIHKLNQLIPTLQPGDTIFFKRGDIFNGSITINCKGRANAPIVFTAYGSGPKPVISGMTSVSQWFPSGQGIFKSNSLPANTRVNMVLIDGKNYAMGRYPNANAPNKGYLDIDDASGKNQITSNGLSFYPNWRGAEAVVRMRRWILNKEKVNLHVGKKLYISPSNKFYPPRFGYGFFIQNHIKTLDQYGEWYYNPSTRRVYVYFGDALPKDVQVMVAIENNIINIQGSHIEINGLEVFGANKYGIFSDRKGMTNLRVNNCHIRYSGINGVYLLEGANFKLENSIVSHSNNNGVYLKYNTPNPVIRNNKISNTGLQAGMGQNNDGNYIGLYCRSKGLTAINNSIINTGYTALYFYESDVLIKNNFINHFCLVKDDGGGIYTFTGNGPTFFNRKIIDNIIQNGIGAPEGAFNPDNKIAVGIYLDSKSENVEVSGNTVLNCAKAGINLHDASFFNIQHNLFANNEAQFRMVYDDPLTSSTSGIVENNIFLSQQSEQLSLSIKTQMNELKNIGHFSDNFYLRPLEKKARPSFYNSHLTRYGAIVHDYYDLKDWKKVSGKEKRSKRGPISFNSYELKETLSKNKCAYSTFDRDIGTLDCWGGSKACSLSWEVNKALDGGALKVVGPDQVNFAVKCGSLDPQKQYLLKFSVLGQKEGSLTVNLRESFSPFNLLSKNIRAKITNKRTDYIFLFSFPKKASAASVHFNSGTPNLVFWIDNIELVEASAELTAFRDIGLVEINTNTTTKSIRLAGNYMDVFENTYNNNLTLAPFESKVLLLDAPNNYRSTNTDTKNANSLFDNEKGAIQEKWSVFPTIINRSNPKIHIQMNLNMDQTQFFILDSTGKVVSTRQVKARTNTFSLNVPDLPAGLYFLSNRKGGEGKTERFVIMN